VYFPLLGECLVSMEMGKFDECEWIAYDVSSLVDEKERTHDTGVEESKEESSVQANGRKGFDTLWIVVLYQYEIRELSSAPRGLY
jgi:hypothetical protein